jgi:hypothetical protein
VKCNHQHDQSQTLERLLRARAAIASDVDMTPIIPLDRPDEAVLRYVRELAKRLAREDHEAEVARRTSQLQSEVAE